MSTAPWTGKGTQQDFMLKDECIVVDDHDVITGHSNKYSCHRFGPQQPRGILHRAFSVFWFDSHNRLLLQQRARSKVTFPSVWTNTCCSHQLYGQTPEEVDTQEAILDGSVPGAKAAAVRKLQHELGISAEQLSGKDFKFLTRLHYCAADASHPNAEWGEHEIDYILIARGDVALQPNPEEIDDVKFVTLPELRVMMAPESGLSWSPWFRIIAEKFLAQWWEELDETVSKGSKHNDFGTIHHIL